MPARTAVKHCQDIDRYNIFTESFEWSHEGVEAVKNSLHKSPELVGLPGSRHHVILRIDELQPLQDELMSFRLIIDDGSYGPRWEMTIVFCQRCKKAAHTTPQQSVEYVSSPVDMVD